MRMMDWCIVEPNMRPWLSGLRWKTVTGMRPGNAFGED
ncbi:hypothetical protein HPTD01_192 [Halomonas sp. TD01]|nr:hypothetical protein HPTD01_192 [Halomonas sp. TD01]